MGYKYEMHLHTKEISFCAGATAREQVEFYHKLGYAGICVTNHFINGVTHVPKNIPWADRVAGYYHGYELAVEAAKGTGMDVFFGWEYCIGGGADFLVYGLGPEWLLENEESLNLAPKAYMQYVREAGALVVHAHPFREAGYIDMIRLLPRDVDGVEICNANRTDFENAMAKQYAENYGLFASAGSDNHSAGRQMRLAGIEAPTRYTDMKALLLDAASHPEWLFCEPNPALDVPGEDK